MTFCLAIKVKEGLVGVADTRITTGTERLTSKKISIHQRDGKKFAFFIMTSGLRSVRDKAITYFEEAIQQNEGDYNKLYKVVNAFAQQVRRVEEEDGHHLTKCGLIFDLYSLISGQMQDDEEPKVYMLYPQGNWVEMTESSPFFIIGATNFGKPILNRALRYDSPIRFALKAGFLAFDSTRISSTDVGYPIDIVIQKNNEYKIIEQRFDHEDLSKYSKWWQEKISNGLRELPEDWIDMVYSKIQTENP
jgi:putative proteasome-type protease